MNYADALKTIGGLSKPSKMPWWGWSISANDCITGKKLHDVEDSVCSGCYALKGRYAFANVKEAHARRLESSHNPEFVDAFVLVLTSLHERQRSENKENRFRWFDSGDVQSLGMLEAINEIAVRTPFIRHWLPTRELRIVREFLSRHGAFAPNLVVRVSAPTIGKSLTSKPFGLPVATVGVDDDLGVAQCRALKDQGNRCLDCSTCWSERSVNYPVH